jgi:hypothetical protein
MEGRTVSAIAGEPNVRFDVDSQAGGTINNIGGDQTVNVTGPGSGRFAAIARWVWAVGLAVFFAGLAVMAVAIVQAEDKVQRDWGSLEPYHHYVPALWEPAVILLCVGFVVSRFGKLFASR